MVGMAAALVESKKVLQLDRCAPKTCLQIWFSYAYKSRKKRELTGLIESYQPLDSSGDTALRQRFAKKPQPHFDAADGESGSTSTPRGIRLAVMTVRIALAKELFFCIGIHM